MHPKKAGVRGKKILGGIRSLIKLARLANYKINWIPGRNGHCMYWASTIEIGVDLANTEKLIVLAHELGHVFDYTENFPAFEEMVTIIEFWDNYSHGDAYFEREVKAWDFAEYLLDYIGVWSTVKSRFVGHKREALKAYKRRLVRAKRTGRHLPDKVAYTEAVIKVKKKMKEHGIGESIKAS